MNAEIFFAITEADVGCNFGRSMDSFMWEREREIQCFNHYSSRTSIPNIWKSLQNKWNNRWSLRYVGCKWTSIFDFFISYMAFDSDTIYCFSPQICHMACSYPLKPTCIPCGNYVLAHMKVKWSAFYYTCRACWCEHTPKSAHVIIPRLDLCLRFKCFPKFTS